MTAVMLLLLLQPFTIPECSSFDTSGQRAAQIVAVVIFAALVAVWVGGTRLVRTGRGATRRGRALLGVTLPVTLVVTFFAGAGVMDVAVDLVADSSDHAMCW